MNTGRGSLLGAAVYFAVSFAVEYSRLTYLSFFPRKHEFQTVEMPGHAAPQPEFWSMYTYAAMIFLLLSSLVFWVILLVTCRSWSPASRKDIFWTGAIVAIIPILLGKSPLLYYPVQDWGVTPGMDHLVVYVILGVISGLVFGTILLVARRRRNLVATIEQE